MYNSKSSIRLLRVHDECAHKRWHRSFTGFQLQFLLELLLMHTRTRCVFPPLLIWLAGVRTMRTCEHTPRRRKRLFSILMACQLSYNAGRGDSYFSWTCRKRVLDTIITSWLSMSHDCIDMSARDVLYDLPPPAAFMVNLTPELRLGSGFHCGSTVIRF